MVAGDSKRELETKIDYDKRIEEQDGDRE